MQPDTQPFLSLSTQQAQAITRLMGLHGAVQVTEVTRHNHIWRLQVDGESFYLKCYTKDWYGDDVPRTEYCVRHERDAYIILARHGLPTVEVVLARPDCDNPLERPFLVTRALAGHSLNELLAKAEKGEFQALLERAGEYMRRMHALTFAYPGYITGDGPTAAPASGDWQHPAWSVQVCRQSAQAALERERQRLSPAVASQLEATYASLDEQLAPAYQPLRFTQANMHSHQFFLERAGEAWRVTGVVDMEVASAGSAYYDLVAFALEMAAYHPVSTRWWEPFFHGYGCKPEFELFRLQMLTFGEASFKCFGPAYWPGTREEILARLLAADCWEALFVT
jgi:aminoglycoside phosphotransferase